MSRLPPVEPIPLRAVVVEDQPVARRHLRSLLGRIEEVEWVAEASDAASALGVIERHQPDLVFLDIEMPGGSGLDVLRRIDPGVLAIFTTAYDRHAVTAFELQAIDYLLKPFGEKRLRRAITRAMEFARAQASESPGGAASNFDGAQAPDHGRARAPDRVAARLAAAATVADRSSSAAERGPLRRVFVRTRGRILPVLLSEVEHLEAQRDYVALWVGARSHLVRIPLNHIVERLDPTVFVRIHRSHVVNIDRITALVPEPSGRLRVHLESGKVVTASKSRSPGLRSELDRL